MARVFGYIRVSTNKGQTTDNQRKEIEDAGYHIAEDDWYSEVGVSGATPQFKRPAFKAMFDATQEKDICIFSKIDRLGRNAKEILITVDAFKERGVKVVVLQFGGLDMASTAGKFLTSILAACAEMERDLCIERIHSGLSRTKSEGTVLGRSTKMPPEVLEKVCAERGRYTLDQLSIKYGMKRDTIARSVKKWGNNVVGYKEDYQKREVQYKLAEQKRIEKAMRVA